MLKQANWNLEKQHTVDSHKLQNQIENLTNQLRDSEANRDKSAKSAQNQIASLDKDNDQLKQTIFKLEAEFKSQTEIVLALRTDKICL